MTRILPLLLLLFCVASCGTDPVFGDTRTLLQKQQDAQQKIRDAGIQFEKHYEWSGVGAEGENELITMVLEYDRDGLLIKREQYYPSSGMAGIVEPETLTTRFEYNANQQAVKEISQDSAGVITGYTLNTYEGKRLIKNERYTGLDGLMATYTMDYDDRGNRTGYYQLKEDGKKMAVYSATYDDHNRIVGETGYQADGTAFSWLTYDYPAADREIVRELNSEGAVVEQSISQLDDMGKVIATTSLRNGVMTRRIGYERDRSGWMTKALFFDEANKLISYKRIERISFQDQGK